jgi:hypothetical protein
MSSSKYISLILHKTKGFHRIFLRSIIGLDGGYRSKMKLSCNESTKLKMVYPIFCLGNLADTVEALMKLIPSGHSVMLPQIHRKGAVNLIFAVKSEISTFRYKDRWGRGR